MEYRYCGGVGDSSGVSWSARLDGPRRAEGSTAGRRSGAAGVAAHASRTAAPRLGGVSRGGVGGSVASGRGPWG